MTCTSRRLIEKKRDGAELSAEEIGGFIAAFTRGEVADYQMSAWAMAVFFRGMTARETQQLTTAMMESGRVLEYPAGSPPKVDKHSTGGVGDKVSLVLAPLLACDEVWVPMISGRGLGITGGTLDKLESIPGFNVNLDEKRALKQLEKIGVFMIGQTADICPGGQKTLRVARRHRHRAVATAHRRQHHEQKAGGKSRSPRARREIRRGRLYENARGSGAAGRRP